MAVTGYFDFDPVDRSVLRVTHIWVVRDGEPVSDEGCDPPLDLSDAQSRKAELIAGVTA